MRGTGAYLRAATISQEGDDGHPGTNIAHHAQRLGRPRSDVVLPVPEKGDQGINARVPDLRERR
jgi:hypothetical protein